MNITRLDHLNLSVNNFQETIDWYQKIFNFQLVEKDYQDGRLWGVIKSGNTMLCIYEYPERAMLDRFELAKQEIHGINHFSFRITERQQWEEIVRKENLELQYGGEVRWNHSSSWYVNDPTGYQIEVVLWDQDEVEFEPLAA